MGPTVHTAAPHPPAPSTDERAAVLMARLAAGLRTLRDVRVQDEAWRLDVLRLLIRAHDDLYDLVLPGTGEPGPSAKAELPSLSNDDQRGPRPNSGPLQRNPRAGAVSATPGTAAAVSTPTRSRVADA
jgi:hypothetical protein